MKRGALTLLCSGHLVGGMEPQSPFALMGERFVNAQKMGNKRIGFKGDPKMPLSWHQKGPVSIVSTSVLTERNIGQHQANELFCAKRFYSKGEMGVAEIFILIRLSVSVLRGVS